MQLILIQMIWRIHTISWEGDLGKNLRETSMIIEGCTVFYFKF